LLCFIPSFYSFFVVVVVICLVPDPPANIKTAALTADSILVAWMSPVHRNGIIIHYTVYAREIGRKGQAKSKDFLFSFSFSFCFVENKWDL